MDKPELLIACNCCNTQNLVEIYFNKADCPKCTKCKNILVSYFPVKGYVYILSNPKMPGLYKIGYSKRSIEERIKELSAGTGVPAPFQVEAIFSSTDPELHEQEIHWILDDCKLKGREFFQCELRFALLAAIAVLDSCPSYASEKVRSIIEGV